MARVVLALRARRDLLALDWPVIDAIEDALGLLERDPLVGHPLRGRLAGLRSLKVGTYRVIHEVRSDQLVRIVAIRDRGAVYRTVEG